MHVLEIISKTWYWVKDLIYESDLIILPLSWFQLIFLCECKMYFFPVSSPSRAPSQIVFKYLLNTLTGCSTESLNSTYQNLNSTSPLSPSPSPFPFPTSLWMSINGTGTSMDLDVQIIESARAWSQWCHCSGLKCCMFLNLARLFFSPIARP